VTEVDELERLRSDNTTLRNAIMLLHQLANLARESLELEPTYYAVLTGVTAGVGLGLNRAMLFLVDENDRERLRGVAAVGPQDRHEADRVWKSIEAEDLDLRTLYRRGREQRDAHAPLDERVRACSVPIAGDSPVALALRRRDMVRGEGSDDLGGLLHLPTAVATPLRGDDGLEGVLYADNRFTERRIDPDAELVFSLLADHAGRAIDNARAYEQVAEQARTDALTGLPHHGAMMTALLAAIEHATAADEALGLAMIDLDDFKKVNDTHGHLAGDALLAAVAARLRAELRADASAYRYGGEEFAVLLPTTAQAELEAVGERVRLAIGEHPYPLSAELTLRASCSMGMTTRRRGEGATELIARADAALLDAKASGKNRVVIR
jgi:diguanylate cyclase (GGDEF)-like protein